MARHKKIKNEAEETANKQHLMELYEQAEVGMIATMKKGTKGTIGIITEKFLSSGGMPQFWVFEAGHGLVPYCMELITKVERKPTAVVLFSGGGGVEAGMIDAGIEPLLAVEFNPDEKALSEAMSDCHETNFPNCKVIRQTVQELAAEDFPGFPQEPDILWASPMCSNFSVAKRGGTEQDDDVAAAKAIVACIRKIRPKHFILENVPAYKKSQSWKGIETVLPTLGYNFKIPQTVDMSEYGVPQARKRFIAWASRDDQQPLTLPDKHSSVSWYEAIKDLIPNLPKSSLLKGQQRSVDKFLKTNEPEPLLIDRVGGRSQYRVVKSSRPASTILRSHFTDGKGCNRSKFADIWLPDSDSGSDVGASGTTKQLTIECVRRLQSFPDWYEFPEEVAVAGSILGYSVPPRFVELFLNQIANPIKVVDGFSTPEWLQQCQEEINEVQEQIDTAALTQELVPKDSKDYRILQKHINEETDRRAELMGLHSELAAEKGYQLLPVPCPSEDGNKLQYKYELEEEMILSFGYTVDRLHQKTVTRRNWKEGHAQQFIKSFQEGKLVDAYDKSPRNGGKKVAQLRLTAKPYQEKLEDMPESEVALEGYPELSKQEFIDKFFGDFDVSQPLWVIRYEIYYKNYDHPIWNKEEDTQQSGSDSVAVATPGASELQEWADKLGAAVRQNHALSVQTSSKSNEHYTPDEVVEATISTLETIDLDPCSNSHDNPNIPSTNHYTIEDDGLAQSWAIGEGRIYLNPPYSATAAWVDKLMEEYSAGGVKEAVVLVKSATDTKWYQKLDKFPKCLWNGRLTFKGNDSPAPFASSVFYLGTRPERFQDAFGKHGRVHGVPISNSLTPTAFPISQIRRDGGTQPREKLDLNHVAALKEAIADGAELEPVVVFYDGEDYWLADGYHRCRASEESGLEDIQTIIHQGTRREAVLYSVGANAEHKAAKPRNRKDKRRAVMMLLNDPEWSKWSNREIARQCKVSEGTVRNIRDSLTAYLRTENGSQSRSRTYRTKHGTVTTSSVMGGNIRTSDSESVKKEDDNELPILAALSGNNGNGHHTSVPKSPPTSDYVIGFLSNIDQMSAEQLVKVRDRIEQRLQALKCPTFPKNGKPSQIWC